MDFAKPDILQSSRCRIIFLKVVFECQKWLDGGYVIIVRIVSNWNFLEKIFCSLVLSLSLKLLPRGFSTEKASVKQVEKKLQTSRFRLLLQSIFEKIAYLFQQQRAGENKSMRKSLFRPLAENHFSHEKPRRLPKL